MGFWRKVFARLKLAYAHKPWRFAMAVAALSDLASLLLGFTLAFQVALDLITAAALFALLGWRWKLLPGLVAEAIPALAVLPTWTLVLLAIGASDQPSKTAPEPPTSGPTQG